MRNYFISVCGDANLVVRVSIASEFLHIKVNHLQAHAHSLTRSHTRHRIQAEKETDMERWNEEKNESGYLHEVYVFRISGLEYDERTSERWNRIDQKQQPRSKQRTKRKKINAYVIYVG